MYKTFSALALGAIINPGLAFGQGGELPPIVVTATRTVQTVDESLASVTVITGETIERRQDRSLPDVLRGLAGVSVSRSGGPGQPASVFMRGTNSDHILVLIDGVKVGSATLGIVPFQDLPVDAIERIEVVRGPRSSLYGSEAIGGVIQIFTRRGGGETRPRLSVGLGSDNRVDTSLGLAGGGERAWFDANIAYAETDGFNACNGEPLVGGCFVDEPDRDGYSRVSGHVNAGIELGDRATLALHWLGSENATDFDGTPFGGNESETTQQVLGIRASLKPLPALELGIQVGRSLDLSDFFYEGAFVDTFDTRRDTASIQADLTLPGAALVTLGADYQLDEVDGTVDYVEHTRRNTGLFAQLQGMAGRHELATSIRRDDDEQFGGQTTGSLAWGYRPSDLVRLRASYGIAFKAPTFNDLYFPLFGNPGLDPETSESIEIGLDGQSGPVNWSLALYQTHIDELIAFDATTFSVGNIDSARIRGLELVVDARVRDWDLAANLSLTDPSNRSGVDKGNLLPRRPEQSVHLDVDRAFGRVSLGGTLLLNGRSFDDLANDTRLDAYGLVDLRASYRFDEHLLLQARVDNLFDTDYETAAFYNQPGRSLGLTLRYTP